MSSSVRVTKLTDCAVTPIKANEKDAAFDIYSPEEISLPPGRVTAVRTGLVMVAPDGHYIKLLSRSGMAINGITVVGGVIDQGYRQEVKVLLLNSSETPYVVKKHSRMAQFTVDVVWSGLIEVHSELPPNCDTRKGGLGSTGV